MHEINYDVDVFCLKTTFIVHFTKDALFKTFPPVISTLISTCI